ncbi:MAG: 50S ribosomal protein L10 [Lentisphaerae bacterium]|nr:50S ribosomal protein L10 [Lentisphaerota bacterium]
MRSEKTYLVNQISAGLTGSDYVYFVSFQGLKVKDFSGLRDQLANVNANCHVFKNSLIRKAVEINNVEALKDLAITGDVAMVYGSGDPGAVAKVLVDFGKSNEVVQAKGGMFEGALLSAAEIADIAALPSKDVLQAQLLGLLQAPARNLVSILNNKAASILNVLNAYKDKLEK